MHNKYYNAALQQCKCGNNTFAFTLRNGLGTLHSRM